MTNTEKELYNEKITGVHQLIQANADIQNQVNLQVLDKLDSLLSINDRVTDLEKGKLIRKGVSIAVSFIVVILTIITLYDKLV